MNKILLLNMRQLHAIIEQETRAGNRTALAEGLLNLIAVQAKILGGMLSRYERRTAQIIPSDQEENQLSWNLEDYGGGVHTGILVKGPDGVWEVR